MLTMRYAVLAVISIFFPALSFSHGGGLDSSGGHNNHSTGSYHYHGGGSSSSGGSGYYQSSGGSSYYQRSYRKRYPNRSNKYYKNNLKITYPPKQTKKSKYTKDEQGNLLKVNVIKVIDGDTVKVKLADGKIINIRLHGIDSPEGKQRGGIAARTALMNILNGKDIRIRGVDKDKYGRTVAMVYADGKSASETMVRTGYAWAFRKYLKGDLKEKMINYEEIARANHHGLWWDQTIQAPWLWRKELRSKNK